MARFLKFLTGVLVASSASADSCTRGEEQCQEQDGSDEIALLALHRTRAPPQTEIEQFEGSSPEEKSLWADRVRMIHEKAGELMNSTVEAGLGAIGTVDSRLASIFSWGKLAVSLYRAACVQEPGGEGTSACKRCVAKTLLDFTGFCRWCPASQSCEAAGLADQGSALKCSASGVGINSEGQCWAQEFPYQVGDLLSFRVADALSWTEQTLLNLDSPLQAFPTYPEGSTGLFDLSTGEALQESGGGGAASGVVVAASSDWGSGTGEAGVLVGLMEAERPDLTLHLGDVYWVGTKENFDTNMLGIAPNENQRGVNFPKGSKASFLMNGNHEMISGGTGLFENGFGYTGQKATYASYQSDHWRFIALDSAYLCYGSFPQAFGVFDKWNANGARNPGNETSAPQPERVMRWLRDIVKIGDPSDTRGIVLFTHHQPYSDWEPAYLGTAAQLQELLPEGKQVIWFFGHEHRLAIYDELHLAGPEGDEEFQDLVSTYTVYPRMVGNGGFADFPMNDPKRKLSIKAYDNRTYQSIPRTPLEPMGVGFNGYFKMVVDGPTLNVTYITGKCKASGCIDGYDTSSGTTVAKETFVLDPATGRLSQTLTNFELVEVPQDSVPRVASVLPRDFAPTSDLTAQLDHHMD